MGTATELRAQRNYAGHRLAPWLGHLMVSRQETARPLLTPGEVMQLPTDESVVMLSGHAPIRAKKLRYFADSNFRHRVLPAPQLQPGRYADAPAARPDDWTDLAMPTTLAAPPAGLAGGDSFEDDRPRRQPELAEITQLPDFDELSSDLLLLDEDDAPAPFPTQPDPRLQRAARLAALDPDDGIAL
ncbi:Type IV secretory system Conjugative DNA transfer [compost metagenome]